MKKQGKKSSIMEQTGVISENKKNTTNFVVVEDSKVFFSDKELKRGITCTIYKCGSKFSDRITMKLHVEANLANGKVWTEWFKLDKVSYKRYKDNKGCRVDPAKVMMYQVYDPEENYGSEEKDFKWWECRILKDAIISSDVDDEEFIKGVK